MQAHKESEICYLNRKRKSKCKTACTHTHLSVQIYSFSKYNSLQRSKEEKKELNVAPGEYVQLNKINIRNIFIINPVSWEVFHSSMTKDELLPHI